MTKQQKIDRVIYWLCNHHLFSCGGYEHDHAIHAGLVFIADLDDGKERARTLIRSYELAELPAWYDRACKYLKECGQPKPPWPDDGGLIDFGDWSEAFWETTPEKGWLEV